MNAVTCQQVCRSIKIACNKYHLYDANVHAKIAESACEKTLSLKDIKLGIMYKTLPVQKQSRR